MADTLRSSSSKRSTEPAYGDHVRSQSPCYLLDKRPRFRGASSSWWLFCPGGSPSTAESGRVPPRPRKVATPLDSLSLPRPPGRSTSLFDYHALSRHRRSSLSASDVSAFADYSRNLPQLPFTRFAKAPGSLVPEFSHAVLDTHVPALIVGDLGLWPSPARGAGFPQGGAGNPRVLPTIIVAASLRAQRTRTRLHLFSSAFGTRIHRLSCPSIRRAEDPPVPAQQGLPLRLPRLSAWT